MQRPNVVAPNSDVISDKFSESSTVTERTTIKTDEITNSDESSEQEIKLDTILLSTDVKQTIEHSQQKIPTEKSTAVNV